MSDVVIVSFDERGFWHADLYRGASDWEVHVWDNGISPDAYLTTEKGATEEQAVEKARATWPAAEVRVVRDDEGEDDD